MSKPWIISDAYNFSKHTNMTRAGLGLQEAVGEGDVFSRNQDKG